MSPSEQCPKRQPSPSRSPSSDCGPRANQPTPSDNTERLLLIGSDNYLKQTAPLNRGQSSEHVYTLLGKLPQSPSLPVCFSLSLRLMHTHKHTHTDMPTYSMQTHTHTGTHKHQTCKHTLNCAFSLVVFPTHMQITIPSNSLSFFTSLLSLPISQKKHAKPLQLVCV